MKKEHVEELLRVHGLKVTQSRLTMLATLEAVHGPVSAEELHKKLIKTPVDLVSIYRNLEVFSKVGIVRKIDLRRGSLCYEIAHDHHHHIVCTRCGEIEKIDSCRVEKMLDGILLKSKKFKSVTDHSFELFGLCTKCSL